ncbi:hypothetical protein PR003_g21227 [Phytophthora rubi]|uniref:Uncharacterized protein n=1 Tax=Phytophthora rubi TaxID=129364 RepID=A0A6A4DDH5_9STRA|nr:hypothetical protein PR003_g21227 [Phytophthora rubi]
MSHGATSNLDLRHGPPTAVAVLVPFNGSERWRRWQCRYRLTAANDGGGGAPATSGNSSSTGVTASQGNGSSRRRGVDSAEVIAPLPITRHSRRATAAVGGSSMSWAHGNKEQEQERTATDDNG